MIICRPQTPPVKENEQQYSEAVAALRQIHSSMDNACSYVKECKRIRIQEFSDGLEQYPIHSQQEAVHCFRGKVSGGPLLVTSLIRPTFYAFAQPSFRQFKAKGRGTLDLLILPDSNSHLLPPMCSVVTD